MKSTPSPKTITAAKVVVFALCLLPLARLVWLFTADGLGANPIEHITRATGWWTLTLLLVTLTVTPARKLLSMPWLLRFRRMLGLFAFFYAVQHFTIYIWLDQFFDLPEIVRDVVKRPFITVGFTAFLLLVPLAATSTNAMVRRLGARRWQWLHRTVYVVAILGVTHFWWLVKKDVREPLVFATILAVLFGVRLVFRHRAAGIAPARVAPAQAVSRVRH